MTSFLANLAERSLNPVPTIQPRLPALFEPPTQTTYEANTEPSPVLRVAEKPVFSAANKEAPTSRSPKLPTEEKSRPAENDASPTLAVPAAPILIPSSQPGNAAANSGEPSPTIRAETAVSAAPTRETTLFSPSPAPKSLPTIEPAPPASLTPAPTLLAPQPPLPAAPPPTLLPPTLLALPPTHLAAPPSPPETRIEPERMEPALSEPRESTSEVTTGAIIQVRIGRIDVRAIAAAGPPKPPPVQKPKPGLSLEEYLQRRQGEVR